jgi:hypothetical protein
MKTDNNENALSILLKKVSIYLAVFLLLGLIFIFPILPNPVSKNCMYKGKKLSGRIELVDTFPDIRVRVVKSNPHLRVQKMKANTARCGEWEIVKFPPSLRVMIDQVHGEIDIQYVNFSPGVE